MFKPKYKLISDDIYEKFVLDKLNSNHILPTEIELSKIYNVSRTTIRKALQELEIEGHLKQVINKGFMISTNPINLVNLNTVNLIDDSLRNPQKATSKVIANIIINCDDFIANKLKIEKGSKVFYLKRIRYVDNKIYSYMENYVPLELCPNINNINFEKIGLWEYIKSLKFDPVIKQQELKVRQSLEMERYYLELDKFTPVMIVQNLGFHQNTPIDYSIVITNAYYTYISYTFKA